MLTSVTMRALKCCGGNQWWNDTFLYSPQTKRDEPSNVVDYEKIDEDARVSHAADFFHDVRY